MVHCLGGCFLDLIGSGTSISTGGLGFYYSKDLGNGFSAVNDTTFRPGGYTALLIASLVAPEVTIPILSRSIPVRGIPIFLRL